jgi:membrane-associated phospholipid phosphatase
MFHLDANAQFSANKDIQLVNCTSLKKYTVAIPVTLIVTGAILSNSKFKIDLQKNIVGNSKTKVDNYLQFAPAGITIGLETIGMKGKHNPLQTALIFTMSNVILNSIVQPLKHFTKVKRPDNSDYKSFPSGHTTEAFASAELMRLELDGNYPWLGFTGYLMAATTGYLRMYNNKHWISDIITGAGIGIASTNLSVFIFDKMAARFKQKHHRNQHSIFLPTYQNKQICIHWIKRF